MTSQFELLDIFYVYANQSEASADSSPEDRVTPVNIPQTFPSEVVTNIESTKFVALSPVTKELETYQYDVIVSSYDSMASFQLGESVVEIDFPRLRNQSKLEKLFISSSNKTAEGELFVAASNQVINITADVDLTNMSHGSVMLNFYKVKNLSTDPDCVYWQEGINSWSTHGLEMFGSNETHIKCSTAHLTNFAAVYYLYQPTQEKIWHSPDADFLRTLTIIVCTVSLLSVGFLIKYLSRAFNKIDGNTFLTLNLALALGLNSLSAIVLSSHEGQTDSCKKSDIFRVVFSLYTQIAALSWMGCSGFELYNKIIRVAAGNLTSAPRKYYRVRVNF